MLAMIHAMLTTTERRQLRYAFNKLKILKDVIAISRIKMEMVANAMEDKYLKRSILTFVAETSPCEEEIKKQMDSLSHVFPVNDLQSGLKECDDHLTFQDPFSCATHYEKQTIQAFRLLLNDADIIPGIRSSLQNHLNEMLYAFLKIKLLNSFSLKELSGERSLF